MFLRQTYLNKPCWKRKETKPTNNTNKLEILLLKKKKKKLKTKKSEIFGPSMKQRKKIKKENREKMELSNRLIKDRIIKDIRILFKQKEEDHYKIKRLSNSWIAN